MTNATYISGPMTSIPNLNFPAFFAAAAELRARGLTVINPAENEEIAAQPWAYYMRKDIKLLMECREIYMLLGWRASKGARLEHRIAVEMGFAVSGADK